jgi:hypothetical protein
MPESKFDCDSMFNKWAAPFGVDAWLQAAPARVGIATLTAFWVTAGLSPTIPANLDTTDGVRYPLIRSRRFPAIAVPPSGSDGVLAGLPHAHITENRAQSQFLIRGMVFLPDICGNCL